MTIRNDGTTILYFKGRAVPPGRTISLGLDWTAEVLRFQQQGIVTMVPDESAETKKPKGTKVPRGTEEE